MLRVNKDGAHLFLGDCHAVQGDGECNGMGAIGIAARLTRTFASFALPVLRPTAANP